jgi:gliding motility-associated-like protein
LTAIAGELHIYANDIINVDGFINISSITSNLRIDNNDDLTNLDGFANLISVGEDLRITGCNILTSFAGFLNLTDVGNYFQLNNNSGLLQLDGLENLSSVGGTFAIANNESLANCCAVKDLLNTSGAIGGSISIFNNESECDSFTEILDATCERLEISINIPCFGANNGSIQVQVIGATAPFTFLWERTEDGQTATGSSNEPNFIIDNLSEGTYSLTVTDAEGLELIKENILLISEIGSIFEIIEITTTNSSNGFNNGEINLIVAGGTPPYQLSWLGLSSGIQANVADSIFMIPTLVQGEYEIMVSDDIGNQQTVEITLLDEIVPIFPCTQPLDIMILNDVSGSVDAIEYNESKQFFVDFLNATNIGMGGEDSRAAIIEWSSAFSQSVQIPMTGEFSNLQSYVNNIRAFSGGTNPHEALTFGENYLANNARPDAARILVLSTDGSGGQISPSLASLADQYKAAGYHIITIAFDNAFAESYTRSILREVASIDLLAPGAPAYSQLDQGLAENIVNLYLCPIAPGSSATVYFNRDGALDIIDISANGGCPTPDNVDLTFTVEALRELSIPSGTPVTFYYNNPALFAATPILTWQVPCAIPIGSTEVFTVTLPVVAAANIYAVFNDDGNQSPPIAFPITNINELAYSNNISDTTICTEPLPTLQTFKYTTTPTPICNNIVIYTVDICNISDLDATGVLVMDDAPADFILLNSVVNSNGCSTDNNGSFDIPGGCCISITYTYDATAAANENYNDQDVLLMGDINQIYQDFDGATTAVEDVLIDGTVDCPSTIIEFTKVVNVTEICEDAFVVYTFTINNQLNIPLQGLLLTDVLPMPVSWVFQPYNLNGLSISNSTFDAGNATFIIDEVVANTIATFSMDAALGDWVADGVLNNSATLENVPNLDMGGIEILTSNTVSTNIFAAPEIEVIQTINCDSTVTLSAIFNTQNSTDWSWQTTGDGTFSMNNAASTVYSMGNADLSNGEVPLSVTGNSNCGEINENILIEMTESDSILLSLEICENEMIDYNGTLLAVGDMQDFIFQNSNGCDSIVSVTVLGFANSSNYLTFEICDGETFDYNGTTLSAGNTQDFPFQNSNGCDSIVSVTVVELSNSSNDLILETCDGELDYNGTTLSVGDTQDFIFQNSSGCDSIISITVVGSTSSEEKLNLETCDGTSMIYNGVELSVGEQQIFTFKNAQGCDSIITVTLNQNGLIGTHALPNIFSPNGDAINDCFQAYFSEAVSIQAFKLDIYNHWGNLVFTTTNPTTCWDGQFLNEEAQTGVYVWVLEIATDACEQASVYRGSIALIR